MAKHNNDSRQVSQRILRLTLSEKLMILSLVLQLTTLIKVFLCP